MYPLRLTGSPSRDPSRTPQHEADQAGRDRRDPSPDGWSNARDLHDGPRLDAAREQVSGHAWRRSCNRSQSRPDFARSSLNRLLTFRGSIGVPTDDAKIRSPSCQLSPAAKRKMNFHDERYRKGELSSGQTRSNTYMFDHKYTTRDDGGAETPSAWEQLTVLPDLLASISSAYGIPE